MEARFEMPSINEAVAAMDKACRVWSLGYDQGNRWDIRDGGECDCSSLVIWALKQGGFDTGDATYTGNMSSNLTKRGWRRLPADLNTCQAGDILLNDTHHVCMVLRGQGRTAVIGQASINEKGTATGGRAGDQTGYETNERTVYLYRHGWNCILRWSKAGIVKASTGTVRNGKLVVDGYGGPATVCEWQRQMGTVIDSVISGQSVDNRKYLLRLWSCSWEGDGESQLARAIQKKVGVKRDGLIGSETVKGIQRFVGVSPDGYCGAVTMKAIQRSLNNGKWK